MSSIHPLFVHFPVALLTMSLLLELLALRTRRHDPSRPAWWLHIAGTAGIAGSVATGLYARSTALFPMEAIPFAENHEQLAFLTAGVFTGLLLWRISSRGMLPRRRGLYLVLFSAGVCLLWAAAWYGGEMVYRFGVGVFPP